MRQRLTKLALYISTAMLGWASILPAAHAEVTQSAVATFFGFTFWDFWANTAAWISNTMLSIMGVWVSITGALLNVSITITLQIKDFVEGTEGVYIVWQTIRDVSGMFIIFMLLYASFKVILSRDEATGVGNLIKNVVIMGVLINFSFFIVSLLIDVSNMASLTLYRSIIATSSSTDPFAGMDAKTVDAIKTTCRSADAGSGSQSLSNINTCVTTSAMFASNTGSLSDVFLTYLKPQRIYSYSGPKDLNAAKDLKPLATLIQGIVGSIIMFTVGLSFALAALAFVARFLILVLLLAFSPIWFAAWVIPQLKDKADEFLDHLKSQLIFMPVYLLLLYASLRILTSSTVFTNPGGDIFSGTGTDFSNLIKGYSILAINDFFIIFLLNIPLITAISMSGVVGKMIKADKFGAEAIWKRVGSFTGRNLYQGTVARGASAISRSEGLKNFAAKNSMGELMFKGIKKTASSYDAKLASQVKERTEFADSLGYDQAKMAQAQSILRQYQNSLAAAKAANQPQLIINSIENDIRRAKTNISTIEKARQTAYAGRIESRINQPETLFMKVARKNKVAAARVQTPIIEKRLTKEKDDLKEIRDDIKGLKKAINAGQAGGGNVAIDIPGADINGHGTTQQQRDIMKLLRDESTKLASVNALESQLDNLKSIK